MSVKVLTASWCGCRHLETLSASVPLKIIQPVQAFTSLRWVIKAIVLDEMFEQPSPISAMTSDSPSDQACFTHNGWGYSGHWPSTAQMSLLASFSRSRLPHLDTLHHWVWETRLEMKESLSLSTKIRSALSCLVLHQDNTRRRPESSATEMLAIWLL